MSNEGITGKEFLAIMVAGVMIMAVLVPTNHPTCKNDGSALVASPRLALQFASGDRPYQDEPYQHYTSYGGPASTNGPLGQSFLGGIYRYIMSIFQF